jgi:hypothetical protein
VIKTLKISSWEVFLNGTTLFYKVRYLRCYYCTLGCSFVQLYSFSIVEVLSFFFTDFIVIEITLETNSCFQHFASKQALSLSLKLPVLQRLLSYLALQQFIHNPRMVCFRYCDALCTFQVAPWFYIWILDFHQFCSSPKSLLPLFHFNYYKLLRLK